LRDTLYDAPFYRLIHSEGDGLPGLVIDRFGDYLSIQVATAGMERLKPLWLPVLTAMLSPAGIVFRNDIPQRKLEGLPQAIETTGAIPDRIILAEGERRYLADLRHGQKTGWFYDQRDNRTHAADLCRTVPDPAVLDVFSHSGGFAMACALAGAHVTLIDSSAL